MAVDIKYVDRQRQTEIDNFFKACQAHRDYYRGYNKSYHPLNYFRNKEYLFQCSPGMTPTYLSFPLYHVWYKRPPVLPETIDRTSPFPSLPERSLAGRFNKYPDRVYVR